MPLRFLIPALLRVTSATPSPSRDSPGGPHPLHSLLKSIILTSRAASQKYHDRIPQILADENEPADPEEEFIWYAYQKDKVGEDEQPREGQEDEEVQERLKNAWLEKFERREFAGPCNSLSPLHGLTTDVLHSVLPPRCVRYRVQIQIILHFLLLSLPGHGAEDSQAAIAEPLSLPPSLSPTKSKKRKRKERGREPVVEPPPQPLEERLEGYMDKLAMWQLMQSVDDTLTRGFEASKTSTAAPKGRSRENDDRDWMQRFCEDVVEPLFKAKLPELCALFRSKLFPDTGNSDTDSIGLSPPPSPKPATKRLKSSTAKSTSTSAGGKDNGGRSKGKEKDAEIRARSRSLSMSLEQEKRERSRSISAGPNALRKRATMFEVTMTTKFSKARAKKAELERTASVPGPGPSASFSSSSSASLGRTQSQVVGGAGPQHARAQREESAGLKREKSMGSVLVAATPAKPRTDSGRAPAQGSQSQTRLPALFASASSGSRAVQVQSQSQARSQPQSQVASSSNLTRVDSLQIDTDTEDDDDDVETFATPTRSRRERTLSHLPRSEDGEEEEWKLDSSPGVLLLGASGSQEWHSSEDEGPPISSRPADLGGFGDDDGARVHAGRRGRGRVLVGDTPTKPR